MKAAQRARSLGRIAAVQAEMVKLAEARLAAARGRAATLDEERAMLAALLGGGEALGAALGQAALRTGKRLDDASSDAATEIAGLQGELVRLRRRDHAMTGIVAEARVEARREAEAEALVETMEAWHARASLE